MRLYLSWGCCSDTPSPPFLRPYNTCSIILTSSCLGDRSLALEQSASTSATAVSKLCATSAHLFVPAWLWRLATVVFFQCQIEIYLTYFLTYCCVQVVNLSCQTYRKMKFQPLTVTATHLHLTAQLSFQLAVTTYQSAAPRKTGLNAQFATNICTRPTWSSTCADTTARNRTPATYAARALCVRTTWSIICRFTHVNRHLIVTSASGSSRGNGVWRNTCAHTR